MACHSTLIPLPNKLSSGYDDCVSKHKGFVVRENNNGYHPRNLENNPLYGVVLEHLETYLARQRECDRTVPRFVERELRSFLDCGVLANGFLRVHCDACGKDRVVAFSCYPQRETMESSPLQISYFTQSFHGFTPHSF